ncbi:MAG: hypothetical protein NC340_01645 [Ruminococcus flavefaciens]|nr:hypothetical protein [Ruminococcus flavefaciens]MCM1228850.1 hypothetical protein [Ruminococcus flavefaciens]
MTAFAIFLRPDGSESRAFMTLSFKFIKEAYIPYTQLSAVFSTETTSFTPFGSPSEYSEVIFYVDSYPVHHGIIDSFRITTENGITKGTVKSRGFTSLLLDNQLEPGLYANISVDKLMNNYYTLPKVTHEKGTDENYIFVKNGTSMWDALVSLSYKLYGTYPHIQGQNKVMLTVTPGKNFVFDTENLLNYGSEMNTVRLVSDFHMADLDDTYSKYSYNNTEAESKNIVRHRYFDLDRRFLYNPEQALLFRNAVSMRGWRRKFCTYSGYKREDLFDTVSFGDVQNGLIKSIAITGDRNGIQTELGVYDDKFT